MEEVVLDPAINLATAKKYLCNLAEPESKNKPIVFYYRLI